MNIIYCDRCGEECDKVKNFYLEINKSGSYNSYGDITYDFNCRKEYCEECYEKEIQFKNDVIALFNNHYNDKLPAKHTKKELKQMIKDLEK